MSSTNRCTILITHSVVLLKQMSVLIFFFFLPVWDRGRSWSTGQLRGGRRETLWYRWGAPWSPGPPYAETGQDNSNTQLNLMHTSRPTGFNTDISTCSLYLRQDLKIPGVVLIWNVNQMRIVYRFKRASPIGEAGGVGGEKVPVCSTNQGEIRSDKKKHFSMISKTF